MNAEYVGKVYVAGTPQPGRDKTGRSIERPTDQLVYTSPPHASHEGASLDAKAYMIEQIKKGVVIKKLDVVKSHVVTTIVPAQEEKCSKSSTKSQGSAGTSS